jgi:hypothetical protein
MTGLSHTDVDVYATVSTSAVATGASHNIQVCGRYTDANTMYQARVLFTVTQTVQINVQKVVGGVTTALTTATTIAGLTHGAGTQFRVRLQIVGTVLRAKIWLASASEPPTWHAETTDTDLASGTQVVMRGLLTTGNTNVLPVNVDWDNVAVVNPQTFTVTRSVNTVIKSHSAGAALSLWQPAQYAL